MMLLREQERSTEYRTAPQAGIRQSFVPEWIAGVIGVVTTSFGLLMMYLWTDGLVDIFGWQWRFAEAAPPDHLADATGALQAWPFSLIIVGTVVLGAVFARVARRLGMDGPTTGSRVAGGLGVVALLTGLVYALIWIF
jgi:hypothetical protein